MNELEETLNRVLSDPAELERLKGLAAELIGGGAEDDAPPERPGFPSLAGLFGAAGGGGGERDKAALLKALAPYLREDRRQRLQKALRVAKAARIAGIAWKEYGGEGFGL